MVLPFMILVLLLAPPAVGQETRSTEPLPENGLQDVPRGVPTGEALPGTAKVPSAAQVQRSLETLEVLQKDCEDRLRTLEDLREQYDQSPTEEERMELFERIRTLEEQLQEVRYDYESVATGIDVRTFDLAPESTFDLPKELEKLVEPLIEEIKDATSTPRQIERLRSELSTIERKMQTASVAKANVEALIAAAGDEASSDLRQGLQASRANWEGRLADLSRERSVARFQLESFLANRTPVLESTRSVLANFFRTRGLNLVLAVATFFLILILLRATYRGFRRVVNRRSATGERPFYARLVNVLYGLLAGVAALSGALIVLYAAGDWVLLGLTLAFIVGIAWAGKTAAPLFLEQMRLLLNLGTVREQERVLVDGIPYRVSKLSFYTLLSNPELAGGVRRLPIKDLIDMRSRITSKDEVWFPTKRHDWVQLSDGSRGKVVTQSPDAVQLELLGGSLVTYPTTDFLALAPQNLSGGFRLTERFGIDYELQPIATTEVPEAFAESLRRGLEAKFGPELLRGLKVEFLEAAASSLDYAILADIAGEFAKDSRAISRAISRICVETCNAKGWSIPFTQITVHQA